MVLHRDIYWLGKQWAVTGYGVQAVSDRHEMRFDIAAARIWDENLDADMRQLPWFDAEDFAKAVDVARKRSKDNPLTFQPPMSDER